MKLRVIALFDTKAKAFMVPQFFATNEMAQRAVAAAVNDPQAGFLHKNPEDFVLYQVADWDDETGTFGALPVPLNLGMCAVFRSAPKLVWEAGKDENAS